MSADPKSIERSAFTGLPSAAGSGDGVIATERHGLGVARIAGRRGQGARLVELLRENLGIEILHGLRRTVRDDLAIAGIGPQTWLAMREGAGNAFVDFLRPLLGDCASTSDQSDAYVMLRLAGPKVREALAKLVPIDLHPRSFQANDLAQTMCGYVNVTLWRLEDTAQNAPVFEIWAGRSFATSLYQAISQGAAESGFVRQTP